MNKVIISIGSNIGNKFNNINKAVNLLKKKSKLTNSSFLYRTQPMYNIQQDEFLNGAIQIETDLNPFELLKDIKSIENNLGNNMYYKEEYRIIIEINQDKQIQTFYFIMIKKFKNKIYRYHIKKWMKDYLLYSH